MANYMAIICLIVCLLTATENTLLLRLSGNLKHLALVVDFYLTQSL